MPETSPFSLRHTKAKVGDVNLHYVIGGSGDPLVLLHGFPETSHQWRKVMPALAERFTVLAPDQRGCGFSDKPPGGYDAWTMAADIDTLTTQLGLERYFIVGHDMGAPVALCHAARYPEKVRGLVYLDERSAQSERQTSEDPILTNTHGNDRDIDGDSHRRRTAGRVQHLPYPSGGEAGNGAARRNGSGPSRAEGAFSESGSFARNRASSDLA